jgi:hypothetical protein
MIEQLHDLPAGVIGFRAEGELRSTDYTEVLLPAISAAVDRGEDLRVLLVFDGWDGMSGGAMAQDLKLGVHHLSKWKRIALVTDVDWMVHLAHVFGWMTPGEMKTFPLAERTAAVAWLADTTDRA